VPIAVPFSCNQNQVPNVKTLLFMIMWSPFSTFSHGKLEGMLSKWRSSQFATVSKFQGMVRVDVTIHCHGIGSEDRSVGW
jgi:hypothetical protein